MHAALVERTLEGRIVGVIARDATEIEAREKPAPKDANVDPPPPAAAPKKRGRPRKGEERPKPQPSRLETASHANPSADARRAARRLRRRLQEEQQGLQGDMDRL
jgi:hypothetical protein